MNESDILQVDIPEIFAGPLDTLLGLIRKHELDIFNIPIAFLTERYLEALDLMRDIELNVSADFIEMAAMLLEIKARMLLPRPPPEEEGGEDVGDPREELVRRLLEYQKYKAAAETLLGLPQLGRDTFSRGAVITVDMHGPPELRPAGLFELLDALKKVLERTRKVAVHEVTRQRMNVAERINRLADLLAVKRHAVFEELFEDVETRFDIVVTFLAVLEMAKIHLVRLYQTGDGETIHVWLAVSDDEGEAGPQTKEQP